MTNTEHRGAVEDVTRGYQEGSRCNRVVDAADRRATWRTAEPVMVDDQYRLFRLSLTCW
jgi:hypothetical protein